MKKKEDPSLEELLAKAKKARETEICIYCKKEHPDVMLIIQCYAHVTCHALNEAEKAKKETIN